VPNSFTLPCALTRSTAWTPNAVPTRQIRYCPQGGALDTLPVNHAPDYAPVNHPTLGAGVEATLTAAGAWIGAETPER
jgi:hippurate hydrolase